MTKAQKRLSKLTMKKLKADRETAVALEISPHALNPEFWRQRAEQIEEMKYDLDEAVQAVKAEAEARHKEYHKATPGLRSRAA